MKRILIFTVFMITTVISFAQGIDPLWLNAVNIARKNNQFVPGKTLYQSDMKNPKDKEDDMLVLVELKHQKKGKDDIETVIISAKKNNKALNPEESKELDKIKEQDFKPKKEGIFLTTDPKKIKVKVTNQKKNINGFICKGFDFEYKGKDEKGKELIYKGIAWLEEECGAPLMIDFTFKKLPMFVKSLNIENYYSLDKENLIWHSIMVKTNVEASFFGKKILNETLLKFSNHWKFL